MDWIRRLCWINCVWCFLALHILNLSVDSPDAQPFFECENLAINDQESLVELIVEKIFGIDNAFPEYDDQDSSSISLKLVLFTTPFASPFQFSLKCLPVAHIADCTVAPDYWQRPLLGNASPPPEC